MTTEDLWRRIERLETTRSTQDHRISSAHDRIDTRQHETDKLTYRVNALENPAGTTGAAFLENAIGKAHARLTALEKSATASATTEEPAQPPKPSAYKKAIAAGNFVDSPHTRRFFASAMRSAAEVVPQGWSHRSDARTRAILRLIEPEN